MEGFDGKKARKKDEISEKKKRPDGLNPEHAEMLESGSWAKQMLGALGKLRTGRLDTETDEEHYGRKHNESSEKF